MPHACCLPLVCVFYAVFWVRVPSKSHTLRVRHAHARRAARRSFVCVLPVLYVCVSARVVCMCYAFCLRSGHTTCRQSASNMRARFCLYLFCMRFVSMAACIFAVAPLHLQTAYCLCFVCPNGHLHFRGTRALRAWCIPFVCILCGYFSWTLSTCVQHVHVTRAKGVQNVCCILVRLLCFETCLLCMRWSAFLRDRCMSCMVHGSVYAFCAPRSFYA